MQRFFDKYGLWAAFVIVGGIILWGLVFAPGRQEEVKKGPGSNLPAPALK